MGRKSTILIIDDDPDIQVALSAVLESRGYAVEGARNGNEGLEKARSAAPDIIILDIMMPNKDGFAVYHELKNSGDEGLSQIPILMLTAVREEASRRRYELETGMRLDPEDYVEKPIEPSKLLEKIEIILGKKKTT